MELETEYSLEYINQFTGTFICKCGLGKYAGIPVNFSGNNRDADCDPVDDTSSGAIRQAERIKTPEEKGKET